jgi:hypothetical protein
VVKCDGKESITYSSASVFPWRLLLLLFNNIRDANTKCPRVGAVTESDDEIVFSAGSPLFVYLILLRAERHTPIVIKSVTKLGHRRKKLPPATNLVLSAHILPGSASGEKVIEAPAARRVLGA